MKNIKLFVNQNWKKYFDFLYLKEFYCLLVKLESFKYIMKYNNKAIYYNINMTNIIINNVDKN
jgi:hypothetical protein